MEYVIIGGVAAGPKTASKIARLDPEASITLIEKGDFLSYAGCGLPYYVSDVVENLDELRSTPVGVVRDANFFKQVKNIDVLTHTEALEIDRPARRIKIQSAGDPAPRWIAYDKLLLATGAAPVVPPLPGIDLDQVHTLHRLEDADRVKAMVQAGQVKKAVIIGGGLIGMEACEALRESGVDVTVVEMLPQVLNLLDWDMARLVEKHMVDKGVRVLTEVKAERFLGENGIVQAVETTAGRLPADLVLIAIGVRPKVELAREAGLELGVTGAIAVDETMRTSDPDIYAAGDCVESRHRVTGAPVYAPLGSTANKQGRVAALNMTGKKARFPGVAGSMICRVFDYTVGGTGLTEKAAREQGIPVIVAKAPATDKAHFMPDAKPIFLKLVVHKETEKILGVQAVGPGEASKRIDVGVLAVSLGMTVEELAQADLAYAPPFSAAMDNLITAANVAQNKLDGLMEGITAQEVKEKLDRGEDFFLLDTRTPQEFTTGYLPGATLIPLGALRSRINEIPKEKEIIAYCKISLRGYEAACILKGAGYRNVKVLDGGVVMWPYELSS